MSIAPAVPTRRRLLTRAGGGLAGILALRRTLAFGQTAPKKLVMAHIVAPPESSTMMRRPLLSDWIPSNPP